MFLCLDPQQSLEKGLEIRRTSYNTAIHHRKRTALRTLTKQVKQTTTVKATRTSLNSGWTRASHILEHYLAVILGFLEYVKQKSVSVFLFFLLIILSFIQATTNDIRH